jgi:hypothetical protein
VTRDVTKWDIRRDWRFGGRWVVLAPYSRIRASFVGETFEEARVAYLILSYLSRLSSKNKRNGLRNKR